MKRFARTEQLFGKATMERFASAKIGVAGLGGVGSSVVEFLARSGIGTLVLNDFDTVSETDINRQIIALTSTVGKPKMEVLTARIKEINPQINVISHAYFCDATNVEAMFSDSDLLVDAIDSLNPKVALLEYAYRNNKVIISCMGAGNRIDPTKIAISDISRAYGCPLLRRVKKYLRKREIYEGIDVVYSTEQPIRASDVKTGKTTRGRHREIVGSVSYLPVIMAGWAVSYILKKLSEQPPPQ